MRIPAAYQRKKARIEIIPLIDIIFFLLATFVMVSMSMVKNQGISVTLPVASTGQPEDRATAKTVTAAKDGGIFLDKEKVSIEELSVKFRALKSQDKDVKVLINGDEAADFGLVVKILDEVRKAGITKVSIQTKGGQGKHHE